MICRPRLLLQPQFQTGYNSLLHIKTQLPAALLVDINGVMSAEHILQREAVQQIVAVSRGNGGCWTAHTDAPAGIGNRGIRGDGEDGIQNSTVWQMFALYIQSEGGK